MILFIEFILFIGFNGFPFEEDFILVKNVPSRSRRQVKVDIEMTTSGTTSGM